MHRMFWPKGIRISNQISNNGDIHDMQIESVNEMSNEFQVRNGYHKILGAIVFHFSDDRLKNN